MAWFKTPTESAWNKSSLLAIDEIRAYGSKFLFRCAAAVAAHICRNIHSFHTLVPTLNGMPTATLVQNTFINATLTLLEQLLAQLPSTPPNAYAVDMDRLRVPCGFAVVGGYGSQIYWGKSFTDFNCKVG